MGHLAWVAEGALWHRAWNLASDSWQDAVQIAGGLSQAKQVALAADADGARAVWLAAGPSSVDPFFTNNLTPTVGGHVLWLPLVQRP
jgi:hypothetical protein